MSLDALAPDQRAVVQLVLQQGRSYADLAGMLGISEEAVRDRAHHGLGALASAPAGLDGEERAEIADFMLNQGSPSAREATRSLLRTAPEANAWAAALDRALRALPGAKLPEIPAPRTRRAMAPAAAEPAPVEDLAVAAPDAEEPAAAADEPELRARPRPRPARAVPPGAAAVADEDAGDEPLESDRGAAPRSNRLGGVLLIATAALVVVALIVFLVGRGSNDDDTASTGSTASSTPVASATATATPNYQPQGQVTLRNPNGGKAKGTMVVFADEQTGQVAFTVSGTGLPANTDSNAYAVWLTGGDAPHRLGYSDQAVGSNGKLGLQGPLEADQANFTKWLQSAKQVVVSLETQENATRPGPVVLRGAIGAAKSGG